MPSPARYRIDPETLREVLDNPADVTGWLDAALATAGPDTGHAEHTELGVAARQLGRLELAEKELGQAVELAADPAQRVLALARQAHVYQWQGRFALAESQSRRCLRDAHLAGDEAHVVYLHAGLCAYDAGDWELAAQRFGTAVRLGQYSGDAEAIAQARTALDAAETAVFVQRITPHVQRLVTAVHEVTAREVAPEVFTALGTPPHAGTFAELGLLGVIGPVAIQVVRGLHRYVDDLDERLDDLVAAGWLLRTPHTMVVSGKGRALLRQLAAAQSHTADRLWGRPGELKVLLDEVVAGAVGTSGGPAFDVLAPLTLEPEGAGAVFHRLNALRYHRIDAHAHAWLSEGLTARQVRELPAGSAARQRIETVTDRIAARAYRPLSPARRSQLLAGLTGLATYPARHRAS
ncbi:tetratricopeptide repeat protein [Amycolatopsis suaedae]|uniref:Tetratricopeptide repeat protein n=1 Tax=Amycolatopsis suaedae TaxID=2510978 RepID=A0A4Q7J7B5_9PSEU|nr:tetratricopeptide repeat protein [Amycolatopsis suaedae]RZQ63067.1 hypothetical protein EWH70_15365 [Amycolatopsis suaedae]